jgi:hypothetical protein
MALDKELWLTTIQEQLFKSDEFLNVVGLDHGSYVDNITVHIPQAGSNPTISKNLTSFPAPIGSRTDADLTYNMDLYYSQPIRVGKDETQFISYDKRASVLNAHLKKMRNVLGNNTLYKWAAVNSANAAQQVRTTGAATSALAPGATGTRKAPTLLDFYNANSILDSQDLNPADARYAIIPSQMYWGLINDSSITKYLEWGSSPVAPSGKVPMIAGITLLKRSSVTVFDNTATPVIKTVGDEGTVTTTATSDNMGILVVSESYVSKALGTIEVFDNQGIAQYYGDVLSAVVAFGASKMRTGGEGIVSIIQAA